MLIKYREGKISSRKHDGRVWIPDRDLNKTEFLVGSPYTYTVDEENNIVLIQSGGPRKVARRKVGDELCPLIDIKNLRVQKALNGCDYITISIYKDRIVVSGHKRTSTSKLEEYQADRNRLTLSSFSFYVSDAPAMESGFDSKGCLLQEDGEGVIYSVPLAQFEAQILPKADTWFVVLRETKHQNTINAMHLMRIFSQLEVARRPYTIAFSSPHEDIAAVVLYLEDCGYGITRAGRNTTICSILGNIGSRRENIYLTVFNHLSEQLANIPKIIPFEVNTFYSGCISDLGFLDEGFKIARAYDLNSEIAGALGLTEDFSNPEDSYRHNIGDHFCPADIAQLNPVDIPTADIWVLSPPCQGFSDANMYTRFLENPKNFNMWLSLQKIKIGKPAVFIMEQVPGVLEVGGGIFVEEMMEELGDIYQIDYKVIDAVETGTPQHRKRAIILGSRLGEIKIPKFKAERYSTVGEAFSGITDDTFNQQDVTVNRPETVERMSFVPPGGNHKNIPVELRTSKMGVKTHSYMYARLHLEKPSITIVNPRKSIIIHPYENRGLSVREVARLMDVPDLYEFMGSLAQIQQQLCNAIPLNLVRAIARVVREHLQSHLFDIAVPKQEKPSNLPVRPDVIGCLFLDSEIA